jgi:hypothetical protein
MVKEQQHTKTEEKVNILYQDKLTLDEFYIKQHHFYLIKYHVVPRGAIVIILIYISMPR